MSFINPSSASERQESIFAELRRLLITTGKLEKWLHSPRNNANQEEKAGPLAELATRPGYGPCSYWTRESIISAKAKGIGVVRARPVWATSPFREKEQEKGPARRNRTLSVGCPSGSSVNGAMFHCLGDLSRPSSYRPRLFFCSFLFFRFVQVLQTSPMHNPHLPDVLRILTSGADGFRSLVHMVH